MILGWRCAIRKGGEVTDILETTSHVEALNFIEFHMCASDA